MYNDIKPTDNSTDGKKIAIVTGLMVLLLVGTFAVYTYQANYEDLNQKYLDLVEQVGAGDGERGDIGAWITFTVIKEDGSRILAWEGHNAMTSLGLDYICEQLAGTPVTVMDWLAIGEGTGGTTTLNNEFDRQQGTFTAGATGIYTLDYTWTAGAFTAETITEAGCLNAGAAGVLLNYQTFGGIVLTATDSLAVEFEFTFS